MAKLLLNSLVGKFGASLYRPMLHPKPSVDGGVDFTVTNPSRPTVWHGCRPPHMSTPTGDKYCPGR